MPSCVASPPKVLSSLFLPSPLEQVYGAIAFYLAHRETIDHYLEEGKAEFARLREESRRNHPQLYAKLDAARERTPTTK
jgi:hypothetical protein